MGLALAPQCCCGFPGFFRWGAHYGFVDLSRVDTSVCSANWAPWMVSCWDTFHEHLGCSFMYTPAMGNALDHDLLGYDSYHDRVYLANAPGHPWYYHLGNEQSLGGVSYFILANVNDCLATIIEAISDVDGQAILDGSDPTSGSPVNIQHFWSDYSNGRIYGFTKWRSDADEEDHFKAWSVLTDGSDYVEHFDLTRDIHDDSTYVPVTMSVADGHVYTSHYFHDGTAKHRFQRDGATAATMTGGAFIYTTYGVYGLEPPIIEVDSQLLSLSTIYIDAFTQVPGIVLVEDGTSMNSQRLQFVASEDGVDVEYYPVRIGWDERLRAGVIMWGTLPLGLGFQPLGKYVTYHTRALEPGNILTQLDHVKVYACLPFGGDFYGNCSYGFGVVIPGKMPPPLTVTGRVITPPPPPPPPPPACDALDECVGLVATGGLRLDASLDTVVDGAGSDGYGGAFTGRTIYYGNFSRNYGLELVTAAPAGPCNGGAPSSTYAFYGNVSDGHYDDYSHPGILLASWEYADPTVHREMYVTDILFGVDCIDGALQLKFIMFGVQVWLGVEGSNWPPTGAATAWSCILPLGDGDTLHDVHPGFVDPTGCAASLIESLFTFGDWFTPSAGDKMCTAFIQVGATP